MTEPTARGRRAWKRWNYTDGPAALAAYTGIGPATELSFMQRDTYGLLHRPDGESSPNRLGHARSVLRKAYLNLAGRGYSYNFEADPWGTRDGQVVRDLFSIAHTSATCLDLAVAFSSVCKLNNLRPLIALVRGIAENPDGGDSQWAHALVIVDLMTGVNEDVGDQSWSETLNPSLTAYQPEPPDSALYPGAHSAVAVISGAAASNWTLSDRYLAVDVARATEPGTTFEEVCESGVEHLRLAHEGYVVEVLHAHRRGVPEIDAPLAEERFALHTNLPVNSAFDHYRSRVGLEEALAKRTGLLVLIGESGTGKSTLARQIAGRLCDGCGWWLDASSPAALTGWLAAREAREAGRDPAAVIEGADVRSEADRARLRLRTATGSWVVVLDNADGVPAGLGALPVPESDNQLLLVTTTNAAWRDYPGAQVEELPGLPDDDTATELGPDVPEAVVRALAGRPLLINASRQFRATAGTPWWEVSPPQGCGQDEAPTRIWAAAQARFGPHSPLRRAAQSISLLPPIAIPVTALAPFVEDPESCVSGLRDLGLVDLSQRGDTPGRSVDGVLMHRLFRSALRPESVAGAPQQSDQELIALASRLLRAEPTREVLAGGYDAETVATLYRLITADSRDPLESVVDLHLLGSAVERHATETAAGYLERTLGLLGWAPGDPIDKVAPEHRRIVVDALRTMSRPAARRQRPGQSRAETLKKLDLAIGWLEQAEELCRGEDSYEWNLARSRTEAMHGIALRGYADLVKSTDLAQARERLYEAQMLLVESHEERKRLAMGASRHDVDRSQFNLAGLEVLLAKLGPRQDAARHLDEAERHYREVYHARRQRYQTEEFEDVVTCVNGFGIVAFFRATLLELDEAGQVEQLRRATAHAVKAAEIRVRLYPGGFDGPDASKSMDLAAKCLLARERVNRRAGHGGPADHATIAEYGFDVCGLAPNSAWIIGTDDTAEVVAAPRDVPAAFPPVPPVGSGPDLRADIREWAASAPIRALVEAFAENQEGIADLFTLATDDLSGFLALLDAFTDRWDTRGGLERNLAGELALTPRQAKLALIAARALGLREPGVPRHRSYDHVVMLGGLLRACMVRPQYAAGLIRRGEVATRSVVALGARRALGGDELDLAREAGTPELAGGAGEFEALDLGTRRAFGLQSPVSVTTQPSEARFGGWETRVYRAPDGLNVLVAAAPSREPHQRRANTPDAYVWFAEHLAHLEAGQRVLAVTTDIYRPQQHAAALSMLALPYGVEVETVGHLPARVEPGLRQVFSPTKYLQEIRSAIRALRPLLETLDSKGL